ncbi:MAG: hypothetical protein LBV41_08230 [Cytophagaceae bacterium]|jgi:hypothetical protein|nr:hypothetical protein [Cytophagaceae bacterium]
MTGGSRNYIPYNAVAFCNWLKKQISYVMTNGERWRIIAFDDEFTKRFEQFERLVARCEDPTCSKVDIGARNDMRKSIEKEVRDIIQGMIIRNPFVTDDDRRIMGLHIRDTKPTPVGDPVGMVTATVKYLNEGALELHIAHADGSPYDKRANYGVKVVYGVFPFDAPAPDDVNMLQSSLFTRRKKELFVFDKKDAGKKAVFCLRYENSKGKSGQWGTIISAVIP